MPIDPSVIAALTVAVTAAPENTALRLHLAGLLLDAERPVEALKECMTVLSQQPDNKEALSLAARSAEASGDRTRAESYRRLYHALDGMEPPTASPPAKPESRRTPDNPLGIPPEEMIPEEEMTSGMEDWSRRLPPLPATPDSGFVSDSAAKEYADDRFAGEDPSITLKDVAGMEAVKRRLNVAFLGPMKNPELRAMYGKSLRGGLLLYGPPGCGKTFIARATAGELGARFVSVGLSDVLDMYIGQSERNLHEIFEQARRHRPCVLFFDEIDALGRKRSLRRESNTRDVVNQLLAEMDSIASDNDGLFILAATNHPWDVDTALRRPGRLDRTLLVLPPDMAAREAILRSRLAGRPQEKIDFTWIASKTEDYSGADMVHLVESAVENAMEHSLTTGRMRPIHMNDVKQAIKDVRPSVRPWFDTARNYALFSNEGGVYDDLLDYLRSRKLI
jgi:AAA+ superfamily predicted ATPase